MSYELRDLVVDRVDLVDEGANSAAFIELYKRKENEEPMSFEEILSKMKPEHAEVIQQVIAGKDEEIAKAKGALDEATTNLETINKSIAGKDEELSAANDALAKANAELETLKAKNDTCDCDGEAGEDGVCKVCGKPKKSASFDETETIKSMPEAARAMFEKMRAQKEAAEAEVRKAAEREAEAAAVAKAASLKAIPVEQEKLVGILKSCTPEIAELLTTINSAIEASVLNEVGKSAGNGAQTSALATSDEAWGKLEAKAAEIAKRDSVTVEKAMSTALDEYPELYREYLNGGAK